MFIVGLRFVTQFSTNETVVQHTIQLVSLGGNDAAQAQEQLAREISLRGVDPLIQRFHVETHAFLHWREFEEGLGIFADLIVGEVAMTAPRAGD